MDGIFGVGLAEMLIIALVLFVVGGPQNAAKWAREAGRQIRKLRRAWNDMMADVERELGPDGKELIDATRELSRSAREIRTIASPQRLVAETTRRLERVLDEPESREDTKAAASPDGRKYRAWMPPDDK